jgi:hypothetical protein
MRTRGFLARGALLALAAIWLPCAQSYALVVPNGGTFTQAPARNTPANPNTTLYINGLNLGPAASPWSTLDLQGNDVVIDGESFATVFDYYKSGYAFGAWNGLGIVASNAPTSYGTVPAGMMYAWFDNAQVGTTEWPIDSGHAVSATCIIGKFTFCGDTNADGMVNGDDYGPIDANLFVPGQGYFGGDINYSGNTTPADYIPLGVNFGYGTASGVAPFLTPLPEPGAVGLMVGLVLVASRRNRGSAKREVA